MKSSVAQIVAFLLGVPLVALSAFVVVPPWSAGTLTLAVAASELSPLLALLDLFVLPLVWRLLRAHHSARGVLSILLVAGACVALWPVARFAGAARSAAAQLGLEHSPPRFSLVAAVRGLGPSPDVVEHVVAYRAADGSPLAMHLYARPSVLPRPTVVVIYGGAWRSGDPTQARNVSRVLAQRGFAVAAIDYRHAPETRFPGQLDDVRGALALLRDSASAWRIDTARVALLGRSSGGQLAELAAYTPGPLHIRAVVSLYAPFDLVKGYVDLPRPDPIGVQEVLRNYLGGTPAEQAAHYRDASPVSHIRPGLPPTLLLYGARDHVVKADFNRSAARALRAAGVPVIAVELPWAEHGFDLAPAGLGAQLAYRVISSFLERELAPGRPALAN